MDIKPISLERHENRKWVRLPNYSFAKVDIACPLALNEIPNALMSLPIGFIMKDGVYSTVAILGFEQNRNLLVGINGEWLGRYVPEAYRYLPFVLLEGDDTNRILCIDEELGKVQENSQEGESFFTDEGEITETVSNVLQHLNLLLTSGKEAQNLSELLDQHGLIEPWPISIKESNISLDVGGLFRISEEKLASLPYSTLGTLRDEGALTLAYCQMLSMRHLRNLVNIFVAQTESTSDTPDFGSFDNEAGLNFDNF
jgi:hypothetical protein